MPKVQSRRRGQIVPKGDRKWLLRVFVGTDAAGKRVYSGTTFRGTYAEAEKELTRLSRESDLGTLPATTAKTTLGEFLTEWLAGRNDLSERSRVNYGMVLERWVIPFVGAVRLDKLTDDHLSRLYALLLKEGKSPRTIRLVHSVLRAALRKATLKGVIGRDPTAGAVLPKLGKAKVEVLTPEQVAKLLEATSETPYGFLWDLLLHSGLRPSEALALEWTDVTPEGRVIVQRHLSGDLEGNIVVLPGTKAGGARTVKLPASTLKNLEAHRKAALERQMATGVRSDLLFHDAAGSYLRASTVRSAWVRALERAGLPHVKLYATRHSHITHLLAAGVSAKAVADRAGHSSPHMTLTVYAHAVPEVADAAADVFEAVVAAGKSKARRKA